MLIEELRTYIREDQSWLFITGAGISIDSGISPYWGPKGCYQELENKYGTSISNIISSETLERNPALLYGYFKDVYEQFSKAEPNYAHKAIDEIAKQVKRLDLITQNIDGLHLSCSKHHDVYEVHGSMHRYKCMNDKCGQPVTLEYALNCKDYPVCPECGSVIRPDVVLIGDPLDMLKLANYQNIAEDADVVVFVGTRAEYWHIAGFANIAAKSGAKLIWVNPEPVDLSVAYCMEGDAVQHMDSFYCGATHFFEDLLERKEL